MYTISPSEQAARDEMFASKLGAPQTTTLTISRPLAELIVEAMLEYVTKRRDYPTDANRYFDAQLMELRRQMNSAFPVTYNED